MRRKRPEPPIGEFNADEYLAAARDHVRALGDLYQKRYYVLTMYVSGLAVECMLRAFQCRVSPQFDSRHDLQELFRSARVGDRLSPEQVEEFGEALTEVARKWANSHRYRSEKGMASFLRRAGLNRAIRGDFLKENARRAMVASEKLVSIGVQIWTN